jgi:hypothetical protein
MKKIFANGCSHMAGDYHVDVPEIFSSWQESRSPASKLGKLLNVSDVINYAKGGASNDRIYRTTIQFINDNFDNLHEYFFLIGWTSSNRSELTYIGNIDHDIYDYKLGKQLEEIDGCSMDHKVSIIQTTSIDYSDGAKANTTADYLNNFWKNFSELYGHTKKQNYIIGLESLLRSLNIKYYFYNAIENVHDNTKLINDRYFYKPFSFENTEFEYLKMAGFKTNLNCNHFDHDATEHWAKIIFNEIKKVYE